MVNLIALFAAAMAVMNVFAFLTIPIDDISLSFTNFHPQALLLFPFAHFNIYHLIENLLGLLLTAALAIELDINPTRFMTAYALGAFIAVPLLFFFPGAVIAGNSTAIFGALAVSLDRARGMIPVKFSYPMVVMFIFGVSVVNSFEAGRMIAVRSDVFHLAGFIAGASATFTNRKIHV